MPRIAVLGEVASASEVKLVSAGPYCHDQIMETNTHKTHSKSGQAIDGLGQELWQLLWQRDNGPSNADALEADNDKEMEG